MTQDLILLVIGTVVTAIWGYQAYNVRRIYTKVDEGERHLNERLSHLTEEQLRQDARVKLLEQALEWQKEIANKLSRQLDVLNSTVQDLRVSIRQFRNGKSA